MSRYAMTVVIVGLVVSVSNAQVSPPIGVPTPMPGGTTAPKTPSPNVIGVSAVPPPQGFYKSGGVLVGADGYFPFDTGDYLLGGTQGLTRSTGFFYMIPTGSASGASYSGPAISSFPTGHFRFFHRR